MSLAQDGTVLVTGAAGFIGYHLADRLLRDGCRVVGVDSLNAYYDPRLKQARLERLQGRAGLQPSSGSTSPTAAGTAALFASTAAQRGRAPRGPGRRALLAEQPARLCRRQPRGLHQHARGLPAPRRRRIWSTPRPARSTAPTPRCRSRSHDNVDHPVSLYAATKKANELMAHTYSHLYGLPVHGLALLHRLRAVGPAGHGDVPVHRGDARGPADPGVQPWPDAARLHLHRRHRRGRAAGGRPSCRRRDPAWSGDAARSRHQPRTLPALQHRQQPAGRADAV